MPISKSVCNALITETFFDGNFISLEGNDMTHINVINNTFRGTDLIAIEFQNCESINISLNDFTDNPSAFAIRIMQCDDSMVSRNRIQNVLLGIYCLYNHNISVSKNYIIDIGNIGIGSDGQCYDSMFFNNTIINSRIGIWLGNDNYRNSFVNNLIKQNTEYAIWFESINNQENIFESNQILGNILEGIYISNNDNIRNIFANNTFKSNGRHVYDQQGGNYYNNSIIGNYWDNYTGLDLNDDGIGDIWHNISSIIRDYLPIWEDGDDSAPPVLKIISPTIDQVIGPSSPDYEISTKSLYIDKMWYVLDHQAPKQFITSLTGTINQTLWDTLFDGNVDITFYANDSLGNSDWFTVTVVVDITLPYIVIWTPDEGLTYGAQAPDYYLVFVELNFESMWYTINGGDTEYGFTLIPIINSTIDQNAWAQLPNGNVTVTFHIKDLAGNIGQESVIIKKYIAPTSIAGYDFFFIFISVLAISMLIIKRKKFTNS
ncbi:MAG: right-handed parallel beta-helix repeat-containing protein [Promethearchaeota archaeon]